MLAKTVTPGGMWGSCCWGWGWGERNLKWGEEVDFTKQVRHGQRPEGG